MQISLNNGANFRSPSQTFTYWPMEVCKSSTQMTTVVKQAVNIVITECNDMDESIALLQYAPDVVILMESMIILAACTRDPSLVSAKYPVKKFVRLRCPTSFKACLYEVACNIGKAFRIADQSMNRIHLALVDLPDYFQCLLEAVANSADGGSPELRQLVEQTIKSASKRCATLADDAVKAFEGVTDDIMELELASIACQATNQEQLAANLARKKKLDEQKACREKEMAERERVLAERQEQVAEALEDYKKEMEKMRDVGVLFTTAFLDILLDALDLGKDALIVRMAGPAPLLARAANRHPAGGDERAAFRAAVEATLIVVLEKALAELENPMNLAANGDTLIDAWKMALKLGGGLSEGGKQAEALIQFLERAKKQAPSSAELAIRKANLKAHLKQVEEAIGRMQQFRPGERKRELLQAIAHRRLEHDQARYEREQVKEDLAREQLFAARLQMADVIGEIAGIDLEKLNLDQVITYLSNGLEMLGHIKKSWLNVALFFRNMNDIVEAQGPLQSRISDLFNLAQSKNVMTSNLDQRQMLLMLSLKSCARCMQVSACARIYGELSRKHIMPVINGVGQNFALTAKQARDKQAQIAPRVTAARKAVLELVTQRAATARENIQQQMAQYATSYHAALGHQRHCIQNA